MAFSALSNAQTTYYLTYRHGGLPNGTPGTALVSDLVAGDFELGSRAKVASTGTTTSGIRTLTMTRLGSTFTVQWTAASTVLIIR